MHMNRTVIWCLVSRNPICTQHLLVCGCQSRYVISLQAGKLHLIFAAWINIFLTQWHSRWFSFISICCSNNCSCEAGVGAQLLSTSFSCYWMWALPWEAAMGLQSTENVLITWKLLLPFPVEIENPEGRQAAHWKNIRKHYTTRVTQK